MPPPRAPLRPLIPRRLLSASPSARPTPSTPSSASPRRRLSLTATISLASLTLLSGYALGALSPPPIVQLINPSPAPPPPPPGSPEAHAATQRIEEELMSLPIVKEYRKKEREGGWYESRPYSGLSEERTVNNLTAGALRGAGRLAVPPVVFAKEDESEAVIVLHAGRGLCGHDGIVHGGLLATLFDESLARTAILNLPSQIGVTAKLSINYRAPTKADQFLVIRTHLVSLSGRKATAKASISTLSGALLADAEALFVEPKYAKLLASSGVREALGGRKTGVGRKVEKVEEDLREGERM